MRVLHITTEFPPIIYGGLGTAIGGLVNASAAAGIDVAVLLVGHGDLPGYSGSEPASEAESDARTEQTSDITIWPVPHSGAVLASVEFAQNWRPDVIHVHVFWLAHVAAAVRRATGAPLVYTVHSLDRAEYELGQGPPECLSQWPIQSDLICDADRIIALTQEERRFIGEYCPEVADRVRVVGNGIADSPHARKHAKTRPSQRIVTVLYTGRFVDRKGIRELLEAAPAFLQVKPNVRLIMAGGHRHAGGEELAAYWLPPSCKPFRDRIFFTGWLSPDEMSNWYADADILVVPSWYEPFGMVILEGMLYGLPIVAASVGGPKEILTSEHTGLFCEPKDSASLGAQVIRLIRDPELRISIGREAAKSVRSLWLHEHVLGRMKGVYDEAASNCRGKAAVNSLAH
jgi:glycosyltransferase involved in cell wall biosynthesis